MISEKSHDTVVGKTKEMHKMGLRLKVTFSKKGHFSLIIRVRPQALGLTLEAKLPLT